MRVCVVVCVYVCIIMLACVCVCVNLGEDVSNHVFHP